eukprot:148123-Amorphochlora_amoeboformis.AAC.3
MKSVRSITLSRFRKVRRAIWLPALGPLEPPCASADGPTAARMSTTTRAITSSNETQGQGAIITRSCKKGDVKRGSLHKGFGIYVCLGPGCWPSPPSFDAECFWASRLAENSESSASSTGSSDTLEG